MDARVDAGRRTYPAPVDPDIVFNREPPPPFALCERTMRVTPHEPAHNGTGDWHPDHVEMEFKAAREKKAAKGVIEISNSNDECDDIGGAPRSSSCCDSRRCCSFLGEVRQGEASSRQGADRTPFHEAVMSKHSRGTLAMSAL
eukprot:jgi/Chlat1/5003/Chrsp32S04935